MEAGFMPKNDASLTEPKAEFMPGIFAKYVLYNCIGKNNPFLTEIG